MPVGTGWSALAGITHRSMNLVKFRHGYEKICTGEAHTGRGGRLAYLGSEEFGKRGGGNKFDVGLQSVAYLSLYWKSIVNGRTLATACRRAIAPQAFPIYSGILSTGGIIAGSKVV